MTNSILRQRTFHRAHFINLAHPSHCTLSNLEKLLEDHLLNFLVHSTHLIGFYHFPKMVLFAHIMLCIPTVLQFSPNILEAKLSSLHVGLPSLTRKKYFIHLIKPNPKSRLIMQKYLIIEPFTLKATSGQ